MFLNRIKLFLIVMIHGGRAVNTFCGNNIILRLFGEKSNIIYIMNNVYYHSNNPKLIHTNYKTIIDSRNSIARKISDYIIQADDEIDLITNIDHLQNTILWDPKISPKRRFLIFLVNITKPQLIFNFAKNNYLINIIIIRFVSDDSFVMYYPKSYCNVTEYSTISRTCNELQKVRYESAAKILRGCKIDIFVATALTEQYSGYNKSKHIGLLTRPLFFLEQMHDWKLKFTTSTVEYQFKIHENKVKDINGSDVFLCEMRLNITDIYRETTDTILFDHYLWLLPIPKKKSNVKVLITIYNYVTWIAIVVTLCFVSLINFIIDIYLNERRDVQRSFLDILGLNLGFGVNEASKSFFYRIFLISYILYSLHVNYIYQGKLSAILTSANYERRIKNVEDLYDSNLKLIAPNFTRYRWKTSNNTLAKKFAKRVHVYVTHFTGDTDIVLKHGNVAFLTKSLKSNSTELQLIDYFPDTLTLTTEYCYALLNGSYYTSFFNDMIRIAQENGFLSKWMNDIARHYRLPKLNDNATLTFEHLTGAFIILFVGLSIGFIVFIGENIAHNFK